MQTVTRDVFKHAVIVGVSCANLHPATALALLRVGDTATESQASASHCCPAAQAGVLGQAGVMTFQIEYDRAMHGKVLPVVTFGVVDA